MSSEEVQTFLIIALVLTAVAGYAFFLGWWARGKALKGMERVMQALHEQKFVVVRTKPDGTGAVEVHAEKPRV